MKLIDMLNNIDTLLLSNSTNESHYKVALEEVSKLLENIQEQGDEDLSNFLWKLKTILIIDLLRKSLLQVHPIYQCSD